MREVPRSCRNLSKDPDDVFAASEETTRAATSKAPNNRARRVAERRWACRALKVSSLIVAGAGLAIVIDVRTLVDLDGSSCTISKGESTRSCRAFCDCCWAGYVGATAFAAELPPANPDQEQ